MASTAMIASSSRKPNVETDQLIPVVSYCVATELAKLKIPMMGEDFQTKLNYLQELQSLCLHEKLQFISKKIDKLEQDFNIESLRKNEQIREHNEILQRQTAVIEEFAVWRFYLDQEHVNIKRTLQAMYEDQKGIQTIQDRMVTEQVKIKKELHNLFDRLRTLASSPSSASIIAKPQGALSGATSALVQQQHQELNNRFLYLNTETTKLGLNLERVKSWQMEFSHQMRNVEGVLDELRSKVESLTTMMTPDISRAALTTEDRKSIDDVKLVDTEVPLTELSSVRSCVLTTSGHHQTDQEHHCEGVGKLEMLVSSFERSGLDDVPNIIKLIGREDDTDNLVSDVENDEISDAVAISEKDNASQCSVDVVPDIPHEHEEPPPDMPIPALVVTEATGSEDSDNNGAGLEDVQEKKNLIDRTG